MSHWQIKLQTQPDSRGRNNQIMKGQDIKIPLLIGDQYHSVAYYMST